LRGSDSRQNRVSGISGTATSKGLGLLEGVLLFLLPVAGPFAATYEQRVIAAVIAGEASNQGRAGMMAVAEVIHQRVTESGWTPFRVVTHSNRSGTHAFSVLNQTTVPALVRKWHLDPVYATALELAQLVCEAPEKLPDTTRSANFFTRLGEKPRWAVGKNPVVVIKQHAFYRIPAEPGARRAW
jgi:spore germination cell wall hydrolase CwlJ-like protein